jgi:hypothetical protein
MKQPSGHPFGRLPRQLRRTVAVCLAAAALGGCAGYGAVLGGPGPRYDGGRGASRRGTFLRPESAGSGIPTAPRASSRHPGPVETCAIAFRQVQP